MSNDPGPNFYLYEVYTKDRKFQGLVGSVSLEDVRHGAVLPHEETIPDVQFSLHEAFLKNPVQKNPILLITDDETFQRKKQELFSRAELIQEQQDLSGNTHRLFRGYVNHPDPISVNNLCIADGHHRIAALLEYYQKKQRSLALSNVMSAVVSAENVKLRSVGVIVNPFKEGLNGSCAIETQRDLFQKLKIYFEIIEIPTPTNPTRSSEFRMLYNDVWYQLILKPNYCREQEQDHLLSIEVFKKFVIELIFNMNSYTNNTYINVLFDECNLTSVKNFIKDKRLIGFVISSDPFVKIIKAAKQGRILEANSTYFEPKFINGMIGHML